MYERPLRRRHCEPTSPTFAHISMHAITSTLNYSGSKKTASKLKGAEGRELTLSPVKPFTLSSQRSQRTDNNTEQRCTLEAAKVPGSAAGRPSFPAGL
jgi:hypothetical protein